MAGKRGLNRDLRGLEVARFPHHYAVRVLPEKCAQSPGEGQSDGFVHRHLYYPLEIVFNWLFHRKQL